MNCKDFRTQNWTVNQSSSKTFNRIAAAFDAVGKLDDLKEHLAWAATDPRQPHPSGDGIADVPSRAVVLVRHWTKDDYISSLNGKMGFYMPSDAEKCTGDIEAIRCDYAYIHNSDGSWSRQLRVVETGKIISGFSSGTPFGYVDTYVFDCQSPKLLGGRSSAQKAADSRYEAARAASGKTKVVGAKISAEAADDFKAECAKRGTNVNAVLKAAIEAFMSERE